VTIRVPFDYAAKHCAGTIAATGEQWNGARLLRGRGSERLVRRRSARARDVRAVAAGPMNDAGAARVAYKTPIEVSP